METTKTPAANRLNPKQLVEQLRVLAASDKTFNAVAHVFAIRERARGEVTLSNLRLRMAREGFHFKGDELGQVLKKLSELGIGTLYIDSDKRIRSLKNIKVTLQSIGQAAVGKLDKLEKFTPDNHYVALPVEPKAAPPKAAAAPAPKIADQVAKQPLHTPSIMPRREYKAALLVMIDDAPVSFPIPKITTEKLGQLLAEFYKKETGTGNA